MPKDEWHSPPLAMEDASARKPADKRRKRNASTCNSLMSPHGRADTDANPTTPFKKKLRRACDYCTKKKVKCNGANPCSQCQKRGLICHFSICQRSGPKDFEQIMPNHQGKALEVAIGGSHEGHAPVSSLLEAGGLVGEEDMGHLDLFLKEFNTFVPITTQAILRDALHADQRLQWHGKGRLRDVTPDHGKVVETEDFMRQHARMAVVQGCVAIGTMIKGVGDPKPYLTNIRHALKQCFDFVSFETMCAYMVLSYSNDLLGAVANARNYMGLAKAIAAQLPLITVDSELVFQFYRVCTEIHSRALEEPPKLVQQEGAAPCYLVLNVLTYALHDIAQLGTKEATALISREEVTAELGTLLPILMRADELSSAHSNCFGALGIMLIKSSLAYVLLRLGRNSECLKALEPLVDLLNQHPGLVRLPICWHFTHCIMVIFLEHGCFKEYESLRLVYNSMLGVQAPRQSNPSCMDQGDFTSALPFSPVAELHQHGNSFLCTNPMCRAIFNDLSNSTPGAGVGDANTVTPINGNGASIAAQPAAKGHQAQQASGGDGQRGGQAQALKMVLGRPYLSIKEVGATGRPLILDLGLSGLSLNNITHKPLSLTHTCT
ncbi:unnamed protein product [Chrysoparadoxa australica]